MFTDLAATAEDFRATLVSN